MTEKESLHCPNGHGSCIWEEAEQPLCPDCRANLVAASPFVRERILAGIWCPTMGSDAIAAAVVALDELIEAATQFARLPFPVSSDKRGEWRVYQQTLRDLLGE